MTARHASPLQQPRLLWTLLVRTVRDSADDRVLGLAAEVAFYALCALPPTLLALLGAAGYLGDALGPDITRGIVDYVLEAAATFLTANTVQQFVEPAVRSVLAHGRADVLSFGLLVAIWSASTSAYVVVDALIIAYDVEVKRSLIRRRLQAVLFVLVGMLGSALLLPLLVAGPRLGTAIAAPLGLAGGFAMAWRLLYWPLSAVAIVLVLTLLYHVAIPWKTPFRRDLPGAILALVLWLVAAAGLRRYALWALSSSSVYGSLAAPIALLLWLYVTALAVLIGAELNAEIEKMWPTIKAPEDSMIEGVPDSTTDLPPTSLSSGVPDSTSEPPTSLSSGVPDSTGEPPTSLGSGGPDSTKDDR